MRRELEGLGYRVVMINGSQVAQVALDQYVVDPGPRRGPAKAGNRLSRSKKGKPRGPEYLKK